MGLGDITQGQNPDDYKNLTVHLTNWDLISEGYTDQDKILGNVVHHHFDVGVNPLKTHYMDNYVDKSYEDESDINKKFFATVDHSASIMDALEIEAYRAKHRDPATGDVIH